MYSDSTLKQQSVGRHVAPLGHISLYSYYLVMRAWQKSSKYHLYCLWFDPTEAETHDLYRTRGHGHHLHHMCGSIAFQFYRSYIHTKIARSLNVNK